MNIDVTRCYGTAGSTFPERGDCPLLNWITCWTRDGRLDSYEADCRFIEGTPTKGSIPSDCPLRTEPVTVQIRQVKPHLPSLPGEMVLWVIYEKPSDHPAHWVVRHWKVGVTKLADQTCQLADSLDEARALIPPGLVCIDRSPEDDPVIVETWL